ncbi:MAG: sulfatase-like hydrolase/transferase, partial [Chloroflexota bacterium]
MSDKTPNVLLIIADQWSTQIANGSGNNHTPVQTPAIDRLAREGIRFEQSYSTFPLCCPARSSIFTGMMPHHHGLIDNEEIYHERLNHIPHNERLATLSGAFKSA